MSVVTQQPTNAPLVDDDQTSDGGFSEVSDFDDGDAYDYEHEITLDSIGKSKTIHFPLRAKYAPNWSARDAFREMVQNWRDAIIVSHDIVEREFHVVRREKGSGHRQEIIYLARRTGSDDDKDCLGFIRFKGRDAAGGSVEICNRRATLQPKHLDIGGTTKADDPEQAGAHGEGLKIGLLVFLRHPQNHSVRCCTGDFNWTFNFTNERRLVARLRRMTPKKITAEWTKAKKQAASNRSLIPFPVKSNGDVRFVIGDKRLKGRNEKGEKVTRVSVSRAEFDKWTTAALFLHSSEDGTIMPSRWGDLLTHSDLRRRIYLKGLLLSETSITDKPLKFGYNVAWGKTNREREALSSADEEGMAFMNIWGGVLETQPDKVSELSDMLNCNDTEYADVSGAKAFLNKATAELLAAYLFGEQFADKWYFSIEEKNENPRLARIIESLGKQSVELTKNSWAVLRKFALVRSTEEEQRRRFTCSEPAAEPMEAFGISVKRLLFACMKACGQTREKSTSFVQAGRLQAHIYYSEQDQLFQIHERWLRAESAIAELGLSVNLEDADVVFHTVKRLFSDALDLLPLVAFDDDGHSTRTPDERRRLELSSAEQRLLDFVRLGDLHLSPLRNLPSLDVERVSAMSSKSNDEVEVHCHLASRCAHLLDELLIVGDAMSRDFGCLEPADEGTGNSCRVYRTNSRAPNFTFNNLKGGETYFALAMNLADPGSVVRKSECARVTMDASPPISLRSLSPAAEDGSYDTDEDELENQADFDRPSVGDPIDESRGDSASPACEVGWYPSSGASPNERPATLASSVSNAPPEWVITTRVLQELDMFTIPPRSNWREATGPNNARGIFVYLDTPNSSPNPRRKRPRGA